MAPHCRSCSSALRSRTTQAFINERTSPDVLSYETELVERVQAQLEYQVR